MYLQVSMEDVELVQSLEPPCDLDEHPPNLLFLKSLSVLLSFADLLIQVSVIGILHNDTSLLNTLPKTIIFNECFLIADDVWVAN